MHWPLKRTMLTLLSWNGHFPTAQKLARLPPCQRYGYLVLLTPSVSNLCLAQISGCHENVRDRTQSNFSSASYISILLQGYLQTSVFHANPSLLLTLVRYSTTGLTATRTNLNGTSTCGRLTGMDSPDDWMHMRSEM